MALAGPKRILGPARSAAMSTPPSLVRFLLLTLEVDEADQLAWSRMWLISGALEQSQRHRGRGVIIDRVGCLSALDGSGPSAVSRGRLLARLRPGQEIILALNVIDRQAPCVLFG